MVTVSGQVQRILRSEKGFVRIIMSQSGDNEITLTAMPSLGVLDPMPQVGDTIQATGLPTAYRGQPQVKLEDRHAIKVTANVQALDSSTAAASQGIVRVEGRMTSYREYEARNGQMLLFTLDDTLSGVMFASFWSQADREAILRLAEDEAPVIIEGEMTTYQGEPSLQAQSIMAAP